MIRELLGYYEQRIVLITVTTVNHKRFYGTLTCAAPLRKARELRHSRSSPSGREAGSPQGRALGLASLVFQQERLWVWLEM